MACVGCLDGILYHGDDVECLAWQHDDVGVVRPSLTASLAEDGEVASANSSASGSLKATFRMLIGTRITDRIRNRGVSTTCSGSVAGCYQPLLVDRQREHVDVDVYYKTTMTR